jgi:hypothetical protein
VACFSSASGGDPSRDARCPQKDDTGQPEEATAMPAKLPQRPGTVTPRWSSLQLGLAGLTAATPE